MIIYMPDFRAGKTDARRTQNPRALAGRKWGCRSYALGYFVGSWSR